MLKYIFAALLLMHTALSLANETRVVYYHNDALGSPVAATDEKGDLLWREEYEAYGKRLIQDDNGVDNTLWFTGKQEESAFGLQYFQARWYDPSIGVFLSRDPVGFVAGNVHSFNKYTYANNNPYKFVDPNGQYSVFTSVTTVNRMDRGEIPQWTGADAASQLGMVAAATFAGGTAGACVTTVCGPLVLTILSAADKAGHIDAPVSPRGGTKGGDDLVRVRHITDKAGRNGIKIMEQLGQPEELQRECMLR